jgi:hypothetical protein
MKLCKDCRWTVNQIPGSDGPLLRQGYGWHCHHPSATQPPARPNYVTGEPDPVKYLSCPEARAKLDERCGPGGRYWESRT